MLFLFPELSSPIRAPLELRLGSAKCVEFMWMFRLGGLDHYKHIETRKYLRLDGEGRCFVPAEDGWKEVPFEDEWKLFSGRA